MLKVEVKTTDTKVKSGNAKRSGKPYSFKEQAAWVYLPSKPFPVEIKVMLDEDQPAYPLGEYIISPESFYVGDFGRIECSPKLVGKPARA